MKNTIDANTLKGLATQFAKDNGYNGGFKPYWRPANGLTFYAFLESFGYAGTALKAHLTRFGYVVAHCNYEQKPQNAAPKANVAPKFGKPVLRKKNTNHALTIGEMAQLVQLAKKAGIRIQ